MTDLEHETKLPERTQASAVRSCKRVFRPAPAIVDKVLLEKLTDAPCPALPKPEFIARQANRLRKQLLTINAFVRKDDHAK